MKKNSQCKPKLVKAEMNHVMAEIELESLDLMISISCKLFEITEAGSVPGCDDKNRFHLCTLKIIKMTHNQKC